MNRRDTVLALLALGAASVPLASVAQQQGNVRRIGFLGVRSRPTPSNPSYGYEEFAQGMRDLGYIEGRNIVIEWRYADGNYDRVPGLAAELARMNLEVIVTHSTPATRALQRATSIIPIVIAAVGDPVGSRFAESLARPGGNITGLAMTSADLYPGQLEMLKALMPALSRVAALAIPDSPRGAAFLKSLQAAAQKLGVTILPVNARNQEQIGRGFGAMKQDRAEAFIVQADPIFVAQRRQLVELAAQNRLPFITSYREDAQAGGLASYGQNLSDLYFYAAGYVDKILKGAKPGELPIEQPTKLHLAINRKTAEALGISVSKEMLFRADELID
jgi:putative ABC transport system substrate-binding protein